MRAHVYVEIISRTAFSSEPVVYYILHFGLASFFRRGHITTTDRNAFNQAIDEERACGVDIISSRLPFMMRSSDKYDCFGDVCFKASVGRLPLDIFDVR